MSIEEKVSDNCTRAVVYDKKGNEYFKEYAGEYGGEYGGQYAGEYVGEYGQQIKSRIWEVQISDDNRCLYIFGNLTFETMNQQKKMMKTMSACHGMIF